MHYRDANCSRWNIKGGSEWEKGNTESRAPLLKLAVCAGMCEGVFKYALCVTKYDARYRITPESGAGWGGGESHAILVTAQRLSVSTPIPNPGIKRTDHITSESAMARFMASFSLSCPGGGRHRSPLDVAWSSLMTLLSSLN